MLIQMKTAASESNVNRNLFAHHENIVVITGLNLNYSQLCRESG